MANLPETRQSLLLELGKHSSEAWTEFLVIYEMAILRFCRSKGLQDADAHDVTQDVLAATLKKLPTWDRDSATGSFRAWMFLVARNKIVDAIRAKSRRPTGSGDSQVARMLTQLVDESSTGDSDFDAEYRRSLFEWASDQVKSQVREVTWNAFRRTAIHGEKAEHVAKDLGVPVGSVYTAKCRVVARIRDKIAEIERDLENDM